MSSNGAGVAGRSAYALGASALRGGARRDRTADLIIANDALSQLSYGPVTAAFTHIGKVRAADKRAPFTVRGVAKSRTAKIGACRGFDLELPLFRACGTDI